MIRTGALFLFLLCSSCASLDLDQKAPKDFQLQRRWARNTLSSEYLGYRRLHRMKPILTDALVIQANAIDGIKAYDRNSGHKRWDLYIENGVEGGAQLADGKIYFAASDGQFYCLDASSGQILWTYPIRSEGLGEPLVNEGKVFFLAGNNVFHALDSQTGKVAWTYNRQEVSQLSIRGGSKPAADAENVYIGFSDGYLVALSKDNGSLKWESLINRNKRFRDVDAHPVLYKDRIFIPSYDGGLYSLEKSSGKILWSREEGGYSAVALDENRLYYGSSDNKIIAVDMDSGKEIWSIAVGGLPVQPTLYRGLVIVGDSSGPVHAFDARNGEIQGHFHPGRGVSSPVTIDPETGEAYFMSVDANLFALQLDWISTWKRWPWEKTGGWK